MKTKLSKIFGVAFALVLVASMLVFAIPAAAGPYAPLAPVLPNTWAGFPPTPAASGFWFFDPNITQVGPIAEAINGDLYAYVANAGTGLTEATPLNPGANDIFKSTDGGHTWTVSAVPFYFVNTATPTPGATGAVIDIVCSSVSEDVVYATDGNYVYKSVNGGLSFTIVAEDSLETVLLGVCGPSTVLTGGAYITCLDVGYNTNGDSLVFIGVNGTYFDDGTPAYDTLYPSVLYINEAGYPSEWVDLQLKCFHAYYETAPTPDVYHPGSFIPYSVGAAPDFATSKKLYVAVSNGLIAHLQFGATYTACVPTDIGLPVVETTNSGILLAYNNTTKQWTVRMDTAADTFANLAAVVVTGGTGAGTTTAAAVIGETYVVSSVGITCSWSEVDQLFWNCDSVTPNSFQIMHASRFAFPSDYATLGTMFIGVTGWNGSNTHAAGGDVYCAFDTTPQTSNALDLNVQGYTTGCIGLAHANICSLDIDENDALLAGAWDNWELQSPVRTYYSADGGWTWTPSLKDPTGADRVYVQIGSFAVAGTRGTDCAFSMSCGEVVGAYWNQISLISMYLEEVLDMSHAPGYLDGSSIMYVLTRDQGTGAQIRSLLKWDGTYWERVHSSRYYYSYGQSLATTPRYDWVEVSPDFNDTGCLYMANTAFEMTRSTDQGCSWRVLAYPCAPLPIISSWIVVDEETVLAAGSPTTAPTSEFVFKTDRHGTRPWTSVPVLLWTGGQSTADGVDFDLSLPRGPESDVLFSDEAGHVYISKDMATTPFNEIAGIATGTPTKFGPTANTYCVFDPGYGTADDPGETMIYAAGGAVVGRCALSAAPLTAQTWEYISTTGTTCVPFAMQVASGIAVAGDTALYVSDTGGGTDVPLTISVTGTIEVNCDAVSACGPDLNISGAAVHPTGSTAFITGELVDIISWNLTCVKSNALADAFSLSASAGTTAATVLVSGGSLSWAITEALTNPTVVTGDTNGNGTFDAGETASINYGDAGDLVTFTSAMNNTIVTWSETVVTVTAAEVRDLDSDMTVGISGVAFYMPDTGCTCTIAGNVDIKGHSSTAVGWIAVSAAVACDCGVSTACSGTTNAAVVNGHLVVATSGGTTAKATGVWRTLNPMDLWTPTLKLVEWEFLSLGGGHILRHPQADALGVYPDDLWITQGSNMLWALDRYLYQPESPYVDYIWMFEDTLATPVVQLLPADGELLATDTTATISWEPLDSATLYQYTIYSYCPTCPENMVPFVTGTDYRTCIVITGLTSGTKYYWKVRVACDQPYVSKWSDLRTFDTALKSTTDLCSPICGASDILPTTNYSWDAVIGATGYELQVVAASADGTVDWTGAETHPSTTNAFASIPGLQYSTVYYWRVRAVSAGAPSAWSECIFTTIAEPVVVEPTPPVVIEENEITPTWIWVIIGIGGALTIAVVILIVTTRRVP